MYFPKDAQANPLEVTWSKLQKDVLEKAYDFDGEVGRRIQGFVNQKCAKYNSILYGKQSENINEILNTAIHEFKEISQQINQMKSMEIKAQKIFLSTLITEVEFPKEVWAGKIKEAATQENFQELNRLLYEGKAAGFINETIDLYAKCPVFIYFAKRKDDEKIISLFFDKGVDLCAKDFFNNTALVWAIANACNGNARQILSIWGKGDYINEPGGNGNTALHMAVGKGYKNISADGQALKCTNLELAHDLILLGCNVNRQNEHGDTPLHLACVRRDVPMIQGLLQTGANPNIPNKDGKIPQELLFCTQQQAQEFLKMTVNVFLLDERERDQNINDAMDLFNL